MDSYNASPASSNTSLNLHNRSASLNLWQRFLQLTTLNDILDQIFNSLDLDSEPKVRCKRDRQGEFYFEVYTSTSGQRFTFDSEKDVREWFERQSMQRPEPNHFRDLMRR
jgi:hypothetical protein